MIFLAQSLFIKTSAKYYKHGKSSHEIELSVLHAKTIKMTLLIWSACLNTMVLSGCSQKFRIESTPSGASVYQGSTKVGETPLTHTAKWRPRKEIPLRIQLPGYRPIIIDCGKDLGYLSVGGDAIRFKFPELLGMKERSTTHVLLIREHGGVGTWRPNDAKKQR